MFGVTNSRCRSSSATWSPSKGSMETSLIGVPISGEARGSCASVRLRWLERGMWDDDFWDWMSVESRRA